MSDQPAKPVTPVHVTWTGTHMFSVKGKGKPHVVDADSVEAPGPVEALLGALATCTATDIIDILAKRRTPIGAMSIATFGTRKATHPRGVEKVLLEFRIDGAAIDREQAERAISLSLTKYCSVRDSLSREVPVEWSLTLNGEAGPLHPDAPMELRIER